MALPWGCHGLLWQCHGSTPMGLDGTPIALLWALVGLHGNAVPLRTAMSIPWHSHAVHDSSTAVPLRPIHGYGVVVTC